MTQPAEKPRCQACGQALNPETAVWLEMSCRRGTYHRDGEVAPEDSQGGFPFGSACARTVLANSGEVSESQARRRNGL